MHPSEVNRLKREVLQLVKAEMDMWLVAEAAETLGTERYVPCERIVETGLIVAYCRAYTPDSKRRCPVTLEFLPDGAALDLHNRLFELRDTVYAHSDETDARVAVDPFGEHSYSEGYRPLNGLAMPTIASLARDQQMRFRAALTEREDALRAAGVPPDATI